MALYLSKLRKFDELSGELGLTAYFEIRWVDETLLWDPEEYGNENIFMSRFNGFFSFILTSCHLRQFH
jgi:hypothetical protein